MQGDPLVSIRCLVYNHEPFLRQCLDGFVMQQTTFPFEAIVHDDASTDGSAAIIREYAEKYPDIIKPIYEKENQYQKTDGSLYRIINAAMNPNSRYIATCEGDDYWTDPFKLQVQIDFLEAHSDYTMSSHDFSTFDENSKLFINNGQDRFKNISYDTFHDHEYHTFDLSDFFSSWIASVLTVVYRRSDYIPREARRHFSSIPDFVLYYYILKQGKCVFFKNNMATYRVHNGGVYSGSSKEAWCEYYLSLSYALYEIEKEKGLLHRINQYFSVYLFNLLVRGKIRKFFRIAIRHVKRLPVVNLFIGLKGVIDISVSILAMKVKNIRCSIS